MYYTLQNRKISLLPLEGSHWQTINEYAVDVFYRPFGARHDRLVGKKITRYTYKVTNFADEQKDAYASVFVYRSRIVACDLSVSGEGGGVYALIGIDSGLFKK